MNYILINVFYKLSPALFSALKKKETHTEKTSSRTSVRQKKIHKLDSHRRKTSTEILFGSVFINRQPYSRGLGPILKFGL